MANKRSKGQRKLLQYVNKHKRLPSADAVFDIYVQHVCKEPCAILPPFSTGKKSWYYEVSKDVMTDKAVNWYRQAVGALVIRGELNLDLQ